MGERREGARPLCIYTFIRGRKRLKTGDHPAIVSPRAQICLIEVGIPRNVQYHIVIINTIQEVYCAGRHTKVAH